MLTVEGAWEQLSVEERLFLLAVAFELPKISGLSVHASDVADNSGFSFGDLMRVARSLKDKNLIIWVSGPLRFQLCGDATSESLTTGKFESFEKIEKGQKQFTELSRHGFFIQD